MNSKRKADLQRRLSMAAVPRPPGDLAERIKSDIPEYLRPDADRKRLTRSVAFNMRVAASILVVISSVIGAIYLLAPEDAMMRMTSTPQAASAADHKQPAATDQVQVEIAQQAPQQQHEEVRLADAAVSASETGAAAAPPRAVAPTIAPTVARRDAVGGGLVANTDAVTVAEAAPAVAPPTPAEIGAVTVQAAAPAVAETRQREERSVAKMTAPSLVSEAFAADLAIGPRSSVFGITIDPGVFHRIKETLENNQRPTANAINVEAIINYFAGGPVKPPRRGVKLEVEGSPSPVGAIGRGGFLRFTIDTPVAASALPVASDAKLEIELNSKVVERASPVGDSSANAPESALLNNLSVTGLYELTIKPNMRTTDRVATVRLTYVNVADGKRQTIERSVYVRDFAKLWTRASRRHRVASLGAVWAESLRATSPALDVAKRAEELATQDPGDERAQELATAATASSKLAGGF